MKRNLDPDFPEPTTFNGSPDEAPGPQRRKRDADPQPEPSGPCGECGEDVIYPHTLAGVDGVFCRAGGLYAYVDRSSKKR